MHLFGDRSYLLNLLNTSDPTVARDTWYTKKNVKRLKRKPWFNLSIKTGLLASGYSVLEVIWWRGDGMVFTFTALGGAWIVRAWWKCAFVDLSTIIQTNASVYRFVVTARVIGRWVVLFLLNFGPQRTPGSPSHVICNQPTIVTLGPQFLHTFPTQTGAFRSEPREIIRPAQL